MTNRLLEKSKKLSLIQERSGGQRSGVIQVWVTDEHTRFERVRELEWRAQHMDTEHSIVVDPTQKFQEVVGFGSALTDAACYLISELPATARRQFLQEVFDPSEMGLSVCRICIGSSDYARSEYSYDDGTPDPEMQRFSIAHDRAYILSILVEALEICPSLFVLAELGVECAGVWGYFFPEIEGYSPTRQMDSAIRYANLMGDVARTHNITMMMEPMADLNSLWPTYREGLAFVRRVDHPHVKVIADMNYFLKLSQPFEHIKDDPELCIHSHIAGDHGQPGVGNLRETHKAFFRVLRDVGYERDVSCACPLGQHSERSVRLHA